MDTLTCRRGDASPDDHDASGRALVGPLGRVKMLGIRGVVSIFSVVEFSAANMGTENVSADMVTVTCFTPSAVPRTAHWSAAASPPSPFAAGLSGWR
jgi:hypothetical protein